MTLFEQFIEFTTRNGIDMTDAFHQREEGYDLITFGENADKDGNNTYNVVFVFYDEDDVSELFIRKRIKVGDRVDVLEKLNGYNSKYRGMSFFLDNDMVSVKSFCATGGEIQVTLNMMARSMELAQELFSVFEPA